MTRLSSILCLIREEAGIRGEEVTHSESGAMLETVSPPSLTGQMGREGQKVLGTHYRGN